jgi:hypothetical protein
VKNSSPRPARFRLARVPLLLVLASIGTPRTPQPVQLNWTTTHRREHLHPSATFMVTVASATLLIISGIKLGERFGMSPILCPSLGNPSRCPIRPVQELAGLRPRSTPSWTQHSEGLEPGGVFCSMSATQCNSDRTQLWLAKNPRSFSQNRQSSAGARAIPRGTGSPGLKLTQHYSIFFFFFFSRTLEIHRKL